MKIFRYIVIFFAILASASCSREPEWTDTEAHKNTEELRKQYNKYIIGTWHYEYINNNHRFFEQITFNDDGSLKGNRKWQIRKQVTVDGHEVFTDWEYIDGENGSYTGTWKLLWERNDYGNGQNTMYIYASFDIGTDDGNSFLAWSNKLVFGFADDKTLSLSGINNWNTDGWTQFQRGEAEPGF